jgi:hypothetical protein
MDSAQKDGIPVIGNLLRIFLEAFPEIVVKYDVVLKDQNRGETAFLSLSNYPQMTQQTPISAHAVFPFRARRQTAAIHGIVADDILNVMQPKLMEHPIPAVRPALKIDAEFLREQTIERQHFSSIFHLALIELTIRWRENW